MKLNEELNETRPPLLLILQFGKDQIQVTGPNTTHYDNTPMQYIEDIHFFVGYGFYFTE